MNIKPRPPTAPVTGHRSSLGKEFSPMFIEKKPTNTTRSAEMQRTISDVFFFFLSVEGC